MAPIKSKRKRYFPELEMSYIFSGSDHFGRARGSDVGRAEGVSEDHPPQEPQLTHGHRGPLEGGDQQVQAHSPDKAAGSRAAVVLLAEQEDKVSCIVCTSAEVDSASPEADVIKLF